MSKRNITYIKPDEPNFLKKLKKQIGYKEGPTIDTKKEDLGPVREEDFVDTEEEQPTVVALEAGDLTAEEVVEEKARLEKKAAEAPADLNCRIVFKTPNKVKNFEDAEKQTANKRSTELKDKKKSKKLKNTTLLSFNEEENDD